MAKKKETESAEGDGKGGRLKLIIAALVLVVVGAVLGGKVLGGGGQAPADAFAPTTTTTEPPGIISTLDPITLNLADGRFLKLGLAFEVRDGVDYPAEGDMMNDDIAGGFAREVDAAITIVSSYTFEDLIAPDGKEMVKRQLLEEVQRLSDDAIKNVLFHEFVMQ